MGSESVRTDLVSEDVVGGFQSETGEDRLELVDGLEDAPLRPLSVGSTCANSQSALASRCTGQRGWTHLSGRESYVVGVDRRHVRARRRWWSRRVRGSGTGLSADVLRARGLGGGELKSRRRERESVDIPSTRRRDASIQNCFNAVAFHVLTVLGNGQSPESELSRTNYVLAGSLDCRALSARCLLPTAELEPILSFKKFFLHRYRGVLFLLPKSPLSIYA